jgi:hypothetical protein
MNNKRDNQPDRKMHHASKRLAMLCNCAQKNSSLRLYMVTDCIETHDPLRYTLRSLSIDLLFEMRELGAQSSSEQHFYETEVIHSIDAITEELDIAYTIGFISEMNHSILSREFRVLKDSILARQASRYIGDVRTLFGTSDHAERLIFPKDLFTETDVKKDIKDKHSTNPVPTTIASPRAFFRTENTPQQKIQKGQDIPEEDKKDRKEKILNIIKDKKQVMIKDIVTSITGCSEKTIQRELSALVAQGVLKKIGEKRWSRYELR